MGTGLRDSLGHADRKRERSTEAAASGARPGSGPPPTPSPATTTENSPRAISAAPARAQPLRPMPAVGVASGDVDAHGARQPAAEDVVLRAEADG